MRAKVRSPLRRWDHGQRSLAVAYRCPRLHVLGIGIAIGMSWSSRRTPAERRLNAAGSRQVYREEEQRPGPD